MESPNKRQKYQAGDFDIASTGQSGATTQTGTMDAQDDFVSLGVKDNANEQYGYGLSRLLAMFLPDLTTTRHTMNTTDGKEMRDTTLEMRRIDQNRNMPCQASSRGY
jgi:hypothetical protein